MVVPEWGSHVVSIVGWPPDVEAGSHREVGHGEGAHDQGMSATDWIAVGSIATALLAAITTVAVWQGRNQSKQLFADRELAWRPALTVISPAAIIAERPPIRSVTREIAYVQNSGGGPAIGGRVVALGLGSRWVVTAPFDVAARGTSVVAAGTFQTSEDGQRMLGNGADGAIFCTDFLDRRWCSPYVRRAEGAHYLTPSMWRETQLGKDGKNRRKDPEWATSELLWPVRTNVAT
jgi:hypothetical protein